MKGRRRAETFYFQFSLNSGSRADNAAHESMTKKTKKPKEVQVSLHRYIAASVDLMIYMVEGDVNVTCIEEPWLQVSLC